MKTLYININGEDRQSTDAIMVVGNKDDDFVNSFYYILGQELVDGAPGLSGDKINIVSDFAVEKPEAYKMIDIQWAKLREILLGDAPTGEYIVTIPVEYLNWLKLHDKYSELYYEKYNGMSQVKLSISIDDLYEDLVGDVNRKIKRFLSQKDNSQVIDKFVVNDLEVIKQSSLVRAIKDAFPSLDFVPLAKLRNEIDFENMMQKNKNEEDNNKDVASEYNSSSFVFAVALEDREWSERRGYNTVNFRFGLCDRNGKKITDLVYHKVVFDDAFVNLHKDRFNLYDDNGHKVEIAQNPLFAKNTEDNNLYLITGKGPILICDYKGGREFDGYWKIGAHKKLEINWPLFQVSNEEDMTTTIYKYDCGDVKKILETTRYIDIEHEIPEMLEKKILNEYEIKHEENKRRDVVGGGAEKKRMGKQIPVYKKEGNINYFWGHYYIDSISSNNKYIVIMSKSMKSYGLVSIDGELLLPLMYETIKEVKTGLFIAKMNRHALNGYYYVAEEKLLCVEILDDYYVVPDRIHADTVNFISKKTKQIVYNNVWRFRLLDKGVYILSLDRNDNGQIVISGNGDVICNHHKSSEIIGDGLYKIDDEIVDRMGNKYDNILVAKHVCPKVWYEVSNKTGYDIWYSDSDGERHFLLNYKGRVTGISLFSDEIIWINTRREGEFLIDRNGNVIVGLGKLYSYRKLSGNLYSAVASDTNKRGVYDMKGEIIIAPQYDNVALITY